MLRRNAIAAVLPLLLLLAAAAPASAANFHSEIFGTTFIHGVQTQQHVFTINNRTTTCNVATFAGQASGGAVTAVVVQPTYMECTAFGLSATVTTTGCFYEFTATNSTAGPAQLTCEPGKEIVINAPGVCVVKITSQTIPGGVDYANQGTGASRDVLVTSTATLITGNVTGPILICGTNGFRSATYTGTTTVKGYSNAGLSTQVGVWVE